MSATEPSKSFWSHLQEFWHNVRKTAAESQIINSKLDDLGLSRDNISSQDSVQLQKMLKNIDDWLNTDSTPQQFGDVQFLIFKRITLSRKRLLFDRLSLLAKEKYEAEQKQLEIQLAKDSKAPQLFHFLRRRDLVANVVAVLLIFPLICVLVIASFKKIVLPEIVGNTLWLVLGHFFTRVKE